MHTTGQGVDDISQTDLIPRCLGQPSSHGIQLHYVYNKTCFSQLINTNDLALTLL